MHETSEGVHRGLEIRKVLPPGEHGVIPTKYIPLGA
jgi:hypothetical protein